MDHKQVHVKDNFMGRPSNAEAAELFSLEPRQRFEWYTAEFRILSPKQAKQGCIF